MYNRNWQMFSVMGQIVNILDLEVLRSLSKLLNSAVGTRKQLWTTHKQRLWLCSHKTLFMGTKFEFPIFYTCHKIFLFFLQTFKSVSTVLNPKIYKNRHQEQFSLCCFMTRLWNSSQNPRLAAFPSALLRNLTPWARVSAGMDTLILISNIYWRLFLGTVL